MPRIERDYLGECEVEDDRYYGAATVRALKLFPKTGEVFDDKFLWAYFMIKKAAALLNAELGYLSAEIANAIAKACDEWETLKEYVAVDPLSGGAGTSVNLNVNEVIANRATELLGGRKGEYVVDPLDHVNLHQSTNDTFVTAGKIATIAKLRALVDRVIELQESIQLKEREFYGVRTLARTQLMDAVPILMGQQFGAWADALARDRWRLNKVEERIRSVNIGGTAVGTGVGAPKEYVLRIVDVLRRVTNVKIAKAENLIDATQNLDVFTEVHGLLKALAVNLYKIANDIRMLGSGPNAGFGEFELPKVQVGSSIMPGKVNPVVPEYVMQICLVVFGHDEIVTHACSQGNLQLNQFAPLVVHYTLKSMTLLTGSCSSLGAYVREVKVREDVCRKHLLSSTSNLTPLVNYLGYELVSTAIVEARGDLSRAIDILAQRSGLSREEILSKLDVDSMPKLGYR